VDKAGNVEPRPPSYSWRSTFNDLSYLPNDDQITTAESAGASPEWQVPSGDVHSNMKIKKEESTSKLLLAVLILVFVIIGLFLVCFACTVVYNRVKQRMPDSGSQFTGMESEVLSRGIDFNAFSSLVASAWPDSLRRFKRVPFNCHIVNPTPFRRYKEVYRATDGFSDSGILGEGGFGKVYSGKLSNGTPVAVKKLEKKYIPRHLCA